MEVGGDYTASLHGLLRYNDDFFLKVCANRAIST